MVDTARQSEFSPNDIALLESILQTETDGNKVEISTYPLFYHSAVEKFEKLLLAKVKSVVEFNMPGKSYVQVSSIGMIRQDKLSAEAKLGIVTVGDFDMSQPLRHMSINETTGEVIPAQVIMPFNFHIDGKKLSIKEFIKDGKIDLEKIPKELLQLVAARIPNQGHNSMMAIEIVGFTPDWLGDAMIVPSAITGQMGSDFDVDKLFTYQRPYSYNESEGKFETYRDTRTKMGDSPEEYEEIESIAIQRLTDLGYSTEKDGSFSRHDIQRHMRIVAQQRYGDNIPTHTPVRDEQNLEELQQEYFNIHWGILMHPGMYTKVLQALDKGDLGFDTGAANDLFKRKSEGPSLFFSPITQLKQFQSGKDAKDLVGMTSLSSTFDSTIQNKALKLGHYIKYEDGSVEEVEDSIRLDGITLDNISGESLAEGFESTYNEDGTPNFNSWYSKHDNITIDQSGAVDNAKDRRLDNLNITMATYPAFDAMNKLHGTTKNGNRSVSKLFQCAMSAQEILWEYTSEFRKASDSLNDEESGTYGGGAELRVSVVKSLNDKYIKLYEEASGQEFNSGLLDGIELNFKNLKAAFDHFQKSDIINPRYYLIQLKVLRTFDYLAQIGERLRTLQKTLNQDTNGAGPNLVYVLQQLENFNSIYSQSGSKIFLNEDSIVSGQTETMFNMVVPVARDLLNSVFPVQAIQSVVQSVAAYTGKSMSDMSLNNQKEIVRHMRYYSVSTSPAIAMDTTVERARLLYGTDTVDSLAKRVEKAKLLYPDDIFLKRLDTTINTLGKGPDFVSTLIQPSGRMSDNMVIQQFAELVQSKDNFLRELGEDLINYAMILTPQSNSTSLIRKVPTGIVLGTDVAANLRNSDVILRAMGSMPAGFIDQLHQHMPNLALKIDKKTINQGGYLYKIEGRDYPEILSLNPDNAKPLLTHTVQGKLHYAPYLRYFSKEEGRTILYKFIESGSKVTYQRISTAGKGNTVEFKDRKSTRLNSSHTDISRMPSSA